MHQPWRARGKLTDRDIARVIFNGALLAICTFLAMYCVRVMGSIRSILLDYADIVVLSLIGWCYGRFRRGANVSSLVLAACGAALILWYNPGAAQTAAEARHAAFRIAQATAANSRFAPPPPGTPQTVGSHWLDSSVRAGLLNSTGGTAAAPPALKAHSKRAPAARAPPPLARVSGRPTDEPAVLPRGAVPGRRLLGQPQMLPPQVHSGARNGRPPRAGRPQPAKGLRDKLLPQQREAPPQQQPQPQQPRGVPPQPQPQQGQGPARGGPLKPAHPAMAPPPVGGAPFAQPPVGATAPLGALPPLGGGAPGGFAQRAAPGPRGVAAGGDAALLAQQQVPAGSDLQRGSRGAAAAAAAAPPQGLDPDLQVRPMMGRWKGRLALACWPASHETLKTPLRRAPVASGPCARL